MGEHIATGKHLLSCVFSKMGDVFLCSLKCFEIYTKVKCSWYDKRNDCNKVEKVMLLDQLKGQLNKPQPLFLGEETAFRSAVLIPLVEKDGEWHVLFEVRALTMRKQPGDISFPGGKIDETDDSPLAAALRETYEELGVNPESIQILGHLSPLVTSPSFVVYPFVGVIEQSELHMYNKDEVEEVITVPLNWLLTHEPYVHFVPIEPKPPADFPYSKIANGENYQWRTSRMEEWFYEYGNYTIWGLTARLLKYFVEKMK